MMKVPPYIGGHPLPFVGFDSPHQHKQKAELLLFQEFPPSPSTLRFIETSPEPEALSAQAAALDKTHSGLDSRWRALLLATGWIQKLVEGKNKRQAERAKAKTHPAPQKIILRINLPESSRKRNAPEPSQGRSQGNGVTAVNQEIKDSEQHTKRRRLYPGNGEAVQALKKHSPDAQASPENSPGSTAPSASLSSSQRSEESDHSNRQINQSKGRFSREIRDKALALKREQKSTSAIEKITGASCRTLGKWFKNANLTDAQAVNFKPHDTADRAEAIRLKNEGLSTTHISKKLEISESTLRGWFRPLGLTTVNWNAHDSDTREKAIQLKAEGVSTERISEELKIHKSTLGAWFRPLNLTKPHKPHLMPHGPDSRQKAIQLRKEGLSTESISKQLDIPTGTLGNWFRPLGLVKKQNHYNPETKQAVIEQYQAKKSVSEIAASTGVTVSTIYSWIKNESKTKK